MAHIGFQGGRQQQQRWLHCDFEFPDTDWGFAHGTPASNNGKMGEYRREFPVLHAMLMRLKRCELIAQPLVRPQRIGIVISTTRKSVWEAHWRQTEALVYDPAPLALEATRLGQGERLMRVFPRPVYSDETNRPAFMQYRRHHHFPITQMRNRLECHRGDGIWGKVDVAVATSWPQEALVVASRLTTIPGLMSYAFERTDLVCQMSPVFDVEAIERQIDNAVRSPVRA